MEELLEFLKGLDKWQDVKEVAEDLDYEKPEESKWQDEDTLTAIAKLMYLEERAKALDYDKPVDLKWTDPEVEEAIAELQQQITPDLETPKEPVKDITTIEDEGASNMAQPEDKDTQIQTQTSVATETVAATTETEKPKEHFKGVYATTLLVKNPLINVCRQCGSQENNTPNGEPICPANYGDNECPRLIAYNKQVAGGDEEEDIMSLGG